MSAFETVSKGLEEALAFVLTVDLNEGAGEGAEEALRDDLAVELSLSLPVRAQAPDQDEL